jgi:hypothetical protein
VPVVQAEIEVTIMANHNRSKESRKSQSLSVTLKLRCALPGKIDDDRRSLSVSIEMDKPDCTNGVCPVSWKPQRPSA